MKKLYRIRQEAMLGGICAGVADMVGVDATIIRLAFVFACAATAFFPLIVTYLVGWYIIPEKPYKEEQNTYKV